LHDRDIYMRVDDSVARVVLGVPRLIRRARGYVPEPFDMGREMPEILACGGELKNTFTITKGRYAIMSQHIGDLTNYEAMNFFEETLWNLKRTFRADPQILAHDMHPDYMSTRFAKDYNCGGAPCTLIPVQHHHAHIASCIAENGHEGKVIGIAFDGTGYGTDGRTWGSEFLIADLSGFERFAHFDYVPLPGGDKAVREPWRLAFSYLVKYFGPEGADIFARLKAGAIDAREIELVLSMLVKKINSPESCGMGRLFDAVSSLIGILDTITFEGEAAISLEMAADASAGETSGYPYAITEGAPAVIDPAPVFKAILEELRNGTPVETISRRFHNTIAGIILDICDKARVKTGIDTVALSGGVFQNRLLFEAAYELLKGHGFRVLTHSKVPTNDACVSLGQAAITAAIGAFSFDNKV
ncbi:MAG: carbamoyltransferase HypF, partial [Nitrospirota bacterium]